VQSNCVYLGRYYRATATFPANDLVLLDANGMCVFSIFERAGGLGANPSNYLNNNGTADANFAYAGAQTRGQPQYTPIYFTLDQDVGDAPAIIKYFSDVANQLKTLEEQSNGVRYYIGVYGSAFALNTCYGLGSVSYFFQTINGWRGVGGHNSRTIWVPHVNIIQQNNTDPNATITVGGFQAPGAINGFAVDFDYSWGDEGSWMVP
jgi:hypothetical protein